MNLNFSLMAIFPEITLIALAIAALILDFVLKNKRAIAWLIIFSLSAILLYLCRVPALNMSLFSGMLVLDSFTLFCKMISVFIAIVVMLISMDYKEIQENYRVEFYSLLLMSVAAMMFLGGTNNLLMIYLGIEFLGLISYIIAAYWRGNLKSSESGLKYFLIGTASSITMLYGISLLYGITGSLDLGEINSLLSGGSVNPAVLSIIILTILIGLAFKIAMAPVHFWCPDVYEGSPTPVTAFFSVGPKLAGFAVLLRFLYVGSPYFYQHWSHLLGILAVVTMVIGNVTALVQTNIKRMLAFSSIAHAGYALIGLVIGKETGQVSLFVYLVSYVIMNLGAFAAVIAVSNKTKSDEIKDYAGLSQNSPYLSAMLTVFLLSLAGIPPLVGFIGKFYIFSAAIKEGFIGLAIAAVVNSVIAAYYYFIVIKTMYLDKPQKQIEIRPSLALNLALILLLIFTLACGLYPQPLINLSSCALSINLP